MIRPITPRAQGSRSRKRRRSTRFTNCDRKRNSFEPSRRRGVPPRSSRLGSLTANTRNRKSRRWQVIIVFVCLRSVSKQKQFAMELWEVLDINLNLRSTPCGQAEIIIDFFNSSNVTCLLYFIRCSGCFRYPAHVGVHLMCWQYYHHKAVRRWAKTGHTGVVSGYLD